MITVGLQGWALEASSYIEPWTTACSCNKDDRLRLGWHLTCPESHPFTQNVGGPHPQGCA